MAESWLKHATETGDKLRVSKSSNTIYKKKRASSNTSAFPRSIIILWFAADTLQEALQDPARPAPTRGQ